MEPKQWGPYIWYFCHKLTFYYLNHTSEYQKKKEILHYFFLFLGKILPCLPCRVFYQQYVKEDPPEKRNDPSDLARWVIHLHNTVNMKLKKPSVSYQEAYLRYYLSDCNHKLLFQAVHYISQWTKDTSWFLLMKEIFPCKICKENVGLLEKNQMIDWKEVALSWMSSHLHENPFGFEPKHKSRLSTSILENHLVLLLHNPERHEKAYVLRLLPVLPYTKYRIVYKGRCPSSQHIAKMYLVTRKKEILPFHESKYIYWKDGQEHEAHFETHDDSMIRLRIRLPTIVEPSILYFLSVYRCQT